MMQRRGRRGRPAKFTLAFAIFCGIAMSSPARADQREQIALSLADMLRSARSVISANQPLNLARIDPRSLHGRLLKALMDSIVEVMDSNQDLINQKGVEFKAFLPAVFARLVSERFRSKVGSIALITVTAPNNLVRNRSARPDPWELKTIERVLLSSAHPNGKHIATSAEKRGRPALRVLIPEYYAQSCLYCHGAPKGEPDITGYPKEGGSVGQLGSVISVTIFDPVRPPIPPQQALEPYP
jgi:hypothetical protein